MHKLKDRLYAALMGVDEFANLSMDRQGEVIIAMERMIVCQESRDRLDKKWKPKDGVIYDESGFSSGAGVE